MAKNEEIKSVLYLPIGFLCLGLCLFLWKLAFELTDPLAKAEELEESVTGLLATAGIVIGIVGICFLLLTHKYIEISSFRKRVRRGGTW